MAQQSNRDTAIRILGGFLKLSLTRGHVAWTPQHDQQVVQLVDALIGAVQERSINDDDLFALLDTPPPARRQTDPHEEARNDPGYRAFLQRQQRRSR